MKKVNKFEITVKLTEIKKVNQNNLYLKIKIVNFGKEDDGKDDGQMYEDCIHLNLKESGFKIGDSDSNKRIESLIGKYVEIKGYLGIKKEAFNYVELEATSINEI